jgi:hypothetical protein
MYAVRLSRNQSGLLGSGTAFWEKRQMRHGRREEGSEDGGGRDKRVGSPRRLSLWACSRFPGIFFGCLLAWLPRHA